MRWLTTLNENIKKTVRSWLNVTPADPYSIQIQEVMDFELHAIRNRIWYRGDGNELEQMYQQNPEFADKYKFWASKCTPGIEMRKIHTGLPALIVRTISEIVLTDMNDFEFADEQQRQIWDEIADPKNNNFPKKIKQALKDATEEVSRGIPLSKPLADSGVFPPMVYHMIEIGEETGNMEDMLDKVAAYYDEEVESATEALLAAMEPLIIIVMAVIVVPIVLAIMMPMYSLYDSIGA